MNAWLGYAWLLFLCTAVAWSIAAVVAAAWAPRAFPRRMDPAYRSRRALLIALLPWLSSSLAAGSVLSISAAKPLGLITDHCVFHGPGHPHLCLQHLPAIEVGQFQVFFGVMVLALPLLLLIRHCWRERRSAAGLMTMKALSRGFGRLRILESEQPLALAASPRNPFVLLSTGMLRQLTRRDCRIVVAHEIAHLRSRDLIRNQMFEVLLLLHFPRAACVIRAAWRQSLEERADDRVAARFGRDAVARTLLRAVREAQTAPLADFGIAGADPVRRIERLLAVHESRDGGMRVFRMAYVAILVAFFTVPGLAHHSVETLLGFLTGG